MGEARGAISYNLSFSCPVVTSTLLLGSSAEHRFPISIFMLGRNFCKHKMEIFGLVFPSIGFVDIKTTISCIC